jgi:hypothetical protein
MHIIDPLLSRPTNQVLLFLYIILKFSLSNDYEFKSYSLNYNFLKKIKIFWFLNVRYTLKN